MKLIIDIPEERLDSIKHFGIKQNEVSMLERALISGIPLDDERLKDIREWLIEHIFRDDYVMFSDAREVGDIDLIEVIASLYNEYHNAVMGEPYDYMFHWANKCGSWVEEDLFDRVLKENSDEEKA